MADCVSDSEIMQAAKSALGVNNEFTVTSSPDDYSPSAANARRNKRAEREAIVEETANAAAASGPTGETLRQGDYRSVRATAKGIRSLYDKSFDARAKRDKRMDDARNLVSGLTVGHVSGWLHNVFTVDKLFRNQRNSINEWFVAYANDPNYQHWNQPLAQMFDTMPNRIQAYQNEFTNRLDKLINSVRPIAQRVGRDTRWVAENLGHYAVLKHIPEANAELLRKWKAELPVVLEEMQQLMASPQGKDTAGKLRDLKNRHDELNTYISQLEANLESSTKSRRLMSAGYTNRQARDMMTDILEKTGVSAEEADAFAAALSMEYRHILEKRVEAGLVPPEQLAAFPEFQHYVALMSRKENLSGATNDARRYDPGSYRTRDGMFGTPDSALDTLTFFANRASMELGIQEFGAHLMAVYEKAKNGGGPDIGLRMAKYNTLRRWQASNNLKWSRIASDILDMGGIVVDVPVQGKNAGKPEFERRYLWFDPEWTGTGAMRKVTGKMLNEAISSNFKVGSKPIEWLGRATSWRSQLNTRMSAGFAIIGGIRDHVERLLHMANRAYFDDRGEKISTSQLMKDYVTNSPRALKILGDALFRDPEKMTGVAQQYWNEYREQGVYQKMMSSYSFDSNPLEAMLDSSGGFSGKLPEKVRNKLGDDGRFLDKWADSIGYNGKRALATLDKWNDVFQNVASFSQYISLREHGMSPERARMAVLEMMNLQQRGTLTPYLRIIAPFVTPTVQSAAAIARTLGLNAASPKDILKQGRNGWLGVLGGFAAFSLLNNMARESMGYDEDGNSRYDSMKVRDLTTAIPISLGDDGTYAKFAIGFGAVRLAQTLAITADRVQRGLMSVEDMAAELLFTAARDVVPVTNPQYDFRDKPWPYIMQVLAPDIIKPFVEASTNTNYFGSSIANEPREGVARADQGRTSTDPIWHKFAKFLQQQGIADVPPEHLQHIAKGYFTGPLRALGAVFDAISGNDTPTSTKYDPDNFDELTPWLQAFGLTGLVGRQKSISRNLYFDFMREMDDKIQRADVVLTAPKNKGNKLDAAAYRRKVLEESGKFTEEEIADYELARAVADARKKIRQGFNEQFGRAWYKHEYPDELREKFAEMAAAEEELYKSFVENATSQQRFRR